MSKDIIIDGDKGNSSFEEFEKILRRKDEITNISSPTSPLTLRQQRENPNVDKDLLNKYTKATKGAPTVDDFFALVRKIVVKVLKKYNIEFKPGEPVRESKDPSEELNNPVIFYNVESRVPRADGRKPRFREDVAEPISGRDIPQRKGTIYGQFFDYDIVFYILANDYTEANKVMYDFEEAMLRYAGYFKSNGVSEMYFMEQHKDEIYDIYREKVHAREIVYRVTLERIQLTFDTMIEDIGLS